MSRVWVVYVYHIDSLYTMSLWHLQKKKCISITLFLCIRDYSNEKSVCVLVKQEERKDRQPTLPPRNQDSGWSFHRYLL